MALRPQIHGHLLWNLGWIAAAFSSHMIMVPYTLTLIPCTVALCSFASSLMLNTITEQFRRTWTNHDSQITRAKCGYASFSSLQDARNLLIMLLTDSEPSADQRSKTIQDLILRSDSLVDYARDMLHAYPYREVPPCWRELYTDAGILKALAFGYLASPADLSSNAYEGTVVPLKHAILACDNVLIMAGASGPGRKPIVYNLIDTFEKKIEGQELISPSAQKRKRFNKLSLKLGEEEVEPRSIPDVKHPIPRLHLPTMDAFQQHVNGPTGGTPIIITGAIDHWPAIVRWTDLDTICRTAGPDRLVPIEIGKQYTDDQWTQKLVTVREFIEQFIVSKCSDDKDEDTDTDTEMEKMKDEDGARKHKDRQQAQVGYLAQHDLFDQIPRLRRDIDIPDYCLIEPNRQYGYYPPDDTLLNAWFGPGGTVSPMHTDPYHNLLAQVVGRKYIRLYAPKETPKLYCFGSSSGDEANAAARSEEEKSEQTFLGNTSQVNVEDPDLRQHPRFAEAEYVETILCPGEMLYIPFQWWHYIRSLSTSFSVSFWF